MKNFVNIVTTIILLLALYYGYNKLFDVYNCRTIIFVFVGLVILTILYFSFRLCFKKDE